MILRPRRTFLEMIAASAALASGCATRAPLVPMKEIALLPVANVDAHYLDPRDIERRVVTNTPAGAYREPDLTQLSDRPTQDRFKAAMGAMKLTVHKTFEAALLARLREIGVAVKPVGDDSSAAAARAGRNVSRLAGGADAVVDINMGALGYRPILRAPAMTPETYVEMDIVRAPDNVSIDGAKYSGDWRQLDDPRHFRCAESELYRSVPELMADLPRAGRNLEAGVLRMVNKVADDIASIYRGKALV